VVDRATGVLGRSAEPKYNPKVNGIARIPEVVFSGSQLPYWDRSWSSVELQRSKSMTSGLHMTLHAAHTGKVLPA
jgi:hypothetical protein